MEPGSPALQADSLPTELSGKPKDGYSGDNQAIDVGEKSKRKKMKSLMLRT